MYQKPIDIHCSTLTYLSKIHVGLSTVADLFYGRDFTTVCS